ncbi:TetR/AcrR family transcriptional regulator [Streptomyces sp. NBC_01352]|uniref:TetR/AcrR family transcriptional regulator n=1 Tax=Streptomyces sp. NBC_01352 TaxID=2903834 RepID=UPI002E370EEB|nr:TetR/AcrR family transcriptional regulator [Streptomyces sp. NBC_01352]
MTSRDAHFDIWFNDTLMNVSNVSDHSPRSIPEDLVQAALRASRARGIPVAEVPLIAVAEEAHMSRSTLLRHLGGTRHALDEAVRAAGVNPGGRKPVRERAVEAAADLISERGLASVTLERVAYGALCSVPSLYVAFGGRDGLLQAVYERYSLVLDDVEAFLAGPREGLPQTVRKIYRLLIDTLNREPRVLPAMLADVLSRPDDPVVQSIYQHAFARMINGVGQWLTSEIATGRIRDLPPLLLAQQMTGPVLTHFLMRPAAANLTDAALPTSTEAIEVFTQSFLHAVAPVPGHDGT